MEERICFTSRISFHPKALEFNVIAASGNKWIVKEDWYNDNKEFVHQIKIKKKEELFNKIYYMEAEINPVENTTGKKICKFDKVYSSNILLRIEMREYVDIIIPIKELASLECKVMLSPIYKLIPPSESEKDMKRRYRRKVHLLEPLKNLSGDILRLLENDIHADVILQCGNREVRAHRNILSARSTWFNKKFQEMMAEDNDHMPKDQQADHSTFLCNFGPNSDSSSAIVLNDLNVLIFAEFFYFIYTGIYNKTYDLQTIKYLYLAARYYGVEDLELKCFVSLQYHLKKNFLMNAIDFLNFACTSEIERLEDMIIKYILAEGRFQDLVSEFSVQWIALLERFPHLRNKFHKPNQTDISDKTLTDISHENLVYHEERADNSVEDAICHSAEFANHASEYGANHSREYGPNHSGEDGAYHSDKYGTNHSEDGACHLDDGVHYSGENKSKHSEKDEANYLEKDEVNYSEKDEVNHSEKDGAYHSREEEANRLNKDGANHSVEDGAYHSDDYGTYNSCENGTCDLSEDRTDTVSESRAVALYSDQCPPSSKDRTGSLSQDRTGSSSDDRVDVLRKDLAVNLLEEWTEVLPDDWAGVLLEDRTDVLFGDRFSVLIEHMADVLPEYQANILSEALSGVLSEDWSDDSSEDSSDALQL